MRGDGLELSKREISECLGWYSDIRQLFVFERDALEFVGISANTLARLKDEVGFYKTRRKIFSAWRKKSGEIYVEKSRRITNMFMALWMEKWGR